MKTAGLFSAVTGVLFLVGCGHSDKTTASSPETNSQPMAEMRTGQQEQQLEDAPNPPNEEPSGLMQAYGVQTELDERTVRRGPDVAAQGPAPDAEVSGARAQMEAQGPDASSQIEIASEVLEACPQVKNNAAFFEFDSAKLESQYEGVLSQLADCLQQDDMQDRKLEIVGHADPRGESEYNMKLGRNRAQTVAEFLRGEGLASDRVVIESAGEKKAENNGRPYSFDRRAVIRFAQ